jgi:hypothetical protein
MMSKEMRDLCLCIGSIGLAYALLLVMVALFTGAKIVKSIVIIATFSSMLFTVGLAPTVRKRLKQRLASVFSQTQ